MQVLQWHRRSWFSNSVQWVILGFLSLLISNPSSVAAEPLGISAIPDSTRHQFEQFTGTERVDSMIDQARVSARQNPEISRLILLETIAYSQEIQYQLGVARGQNGMGVVLQLLGDYTQGLNYFQDALIGFQVQDNKEGQASALQNLAAVQLSLDLTEEALATCQRALALREELGDEAQIMKSIRSLGIVHRDLGNNEKALAFTIRYLDMVEQTGDKASMAKALTTIGTTQLSMGQIPEALASCKEAVLLARAAGDSYGLGVALVNVGEVLLVKAEWDEAIDTTREALQLSKEMNTKTLMQTAHYIMAQAYEETGRPTEALEHYRQYKDLKIDLFTEETSLRIAELTARFEVAQDRNRLLELERDQVSSQLELTVERRQRDLFLVGFSISLPLAILAFFLYRKAQAASAVLEAKAKELELALANLKTLRGLIPICASCKKMRDDEGYWHQVEAYVAKHSHAEFSHGICPHCADKLYGDLLKKKD